MSKKSFSCDALKVSLMILLYLCCLHPLMAQFKDSRGRQFCLMIPGKNTTSQASLYISSFFDATCTVDVFGIFHKDLTLTPYSCTKVDLPPEVAGNNGIIVAASNLISVYGVSADGTSSEAFMALPVTALGTSYIVSSYFNEYGVGSQFGVVATEQHTYAKITPTVYTSNHMAGDTYTELLHSGQVTEEASMFRGSDFTGTTITATKPIGVFAGHQGTSVPGFFPPSQSNRLVEMLPPTSAWGRKVIAVPSKGLNSNDTWRILASQDYTNIYINGVAKYTLNRASYANVLLTDNAVIESDRPILVTQLASALNSPGVLGAPFSLTVPPVEQYLTHYVVPTIGNSTLNFLNIVALNQAVANVTLDGNALPASSFARVGNSGYSAARIQVDSGVHVVVGEAGIGVTAYGFGQGTGYGFAAGQLAGDVANIWKVELRKSADTLAVMRQAKFDALVVDNLMNPVQGVRVIFTIKGANAHRYSYALTDSLGIGTFLHVGENAGTDTVTAIIGTVKDSKAIVWLGGPCNLPLETYVEDATGASANGTVKLVAPMGTPPYTFTLGDRTNTSGIFHSVAYGTYTAQVQDARYCATTATVVVKRKIIPDSANVYGIQKDTVFTYRADELSCKATVHWQEPNLENPATISLPVAYNDANSKLIYKGRYNGHAYYQSTGFYKWPTAKHLAEQKGGHLLTVNTVGENDFIRTNLNQEPGYGPWIGLYNTGTVGQFAWVTGEPFNTSYWYPSEPSNGGGRADSVAEKYVHIWGVDPLNRWNDLNELFYLPFIAEFEGPILSYKQIKGPANGSSVPVGIHQVCYEIFNRIENKTYTTCFNVKVECIPGGNAVQGDTTIIAAAGSCKAPLKWRQPEAYWPQQIWLPGTSWALSNMLQFKTLYNGHAYYLSGGGFKWPEARGYAESVGGHLATITSAAENNMIVNNFKTPGGYGPWIGLYNAGMVNTFIWVTGEYSPAYTNWAPSEPNNQNGEAAYDIREPYVLLNNYDYLARWNDMSKNHTATFITEFESPLYGYKQVFGPEWGAIVDTGTYTICYEVKNTLGKAPGLCCFNIKVVCGNVPSIASTALSVMPTRVLDESAPSFKVSAVPNPSVRNFKVKIASQNTVQRVSVQVVDVSGRVVEVRNNIIPNSMITLGDNYSRGIYFIQVIQGTKQEVIKVVKE